MRALECFNLGLQLDPNNETLISYRELTLSEQEKIKAITQKMKAVQEAQQRGDLTAARSYLVEVLQLTPQNAEATSLLKQVEAELAQIQNRREAQKMVDRAQRALTAQAYPEALSLLENAETLDPDNRHVARLRPVVLAEQAAARKRRLRGEKIAAAKSALERGDLKRAVEEAQDGLEAFPDDPALQQLLLGAQQGLEAAEPRKGEPGLQKREPEPAPLRQVVLARLRSVVERIPAEFGPALQTRLRWIVERLPAPLRPWKFQLGMAGAVLMVAVAAWVIFRPSATKAPPPIPPLGTVSLDVSPWGDVKEVRNLRTQEGESLPGMITPLELPLPAGDYEVVVEHPTLGRMRFTLHVESGRHQDVRKSFQAFDPGQVLKSYR